ncbi:MAG: DUF1223 domain-containing protein [Rhodospirillales bacterium]|nr:DUF1223 domain-containing protein [Rhodospirillales bacterium]MCW8861244.1 DUF1223 domain-containing protein [Rhodospirillales bacterium]MCW8951550.1 DUF1223 domain-containing protein [Rhodospirillales bacterium]MCW9001509.1 DUF1223 domain-containing protein [Rhodospirillales bacterium]
MALILGGFMAALVFSSAPAVAGDRSLTVVELFTSQGCSSCPPADALIGELSAHKDVLPLSFSVDYWDYIGWKDPFADPDHSARQRSYAKVMGLGYVYTPQVVVDGVHQEVGSRRDAIFALIGKASSGAADKVPVGLTVEAASLKIIVPDGRAPDGGAQVYVAVYDSRHETHIGRGENQGKVLANYNVVRSFDSVAVWRGERLEHTIPLNSLQGDGVAVFLQHSGPGPIIGAAVYALARQ